MKKIFKMMVAVVAGFAALTACTNEPEEGVTPTPEAQGFTVIASMDDATKATMSDEAGMAWEVGDQIAVRQYTLGGGSHEAVSNGLAAENIAADGKASFTFGHLLNDNPAYFFYNLNGNAVWKSEFNFNPTMTQESAGVMNKSYLKLRSKEGVEITTTGTNTIETEMNIVGTLARFIIYSSNEEYIGEKVESVNMVSTTTNISGLIAYNNPRNRYWHENGDGIDAGVQGEECKIFWNHGKNIMVSLTNPMEVNTRDAESSQGKTVYMPIPPVKVEGYKYIVTTDKATYTFDATDKTTQFNENELKNIKLNLENGARVDASAPKGDLQYIGDLNGATAKLPSEGITNKDGGYWYAQTRNTGADWVTKEGAANVQFYTGITFECIDNATGEEADWLTVSYRNDGDTHWWITAQPNESSEERSATVTATFPDVDGYIVTEACKTKTVIITQSAAGSAKVISFTGGANNSVHNLQNMSYSNHSLGYMLANIDGTHNREWSKYYTQVEFKCISKEDYDNGIYDNEVDWLTCGYATNASGIFDCLWWIQVEANTSSETRSAVIISTWPEMEGFVYKDNIRQHVAFINQEGGYVEPDPDAPITEGYTYTIVKNNGNPSGATFGMPVGGANGADFRIENIKLNGNAVTLTQTMANEIIATAFKNVDGRPATGYDHFQFATDQIYMKVVSFNGSTMEAGVATTPDSQGYITRLTWYNSDGEEGGYWYVFVP